MNDLVSTLLECIHTPAFIGNVGGFCVDCNSAFEKLIGLRKNQIVGCASEDIERDLVKGANPAQQARLLTKVAYCCGADKQWAGFIGIVNDYAIKDDCEQTAAYLNPRLTKQETQVMLLLAQGLAVKEMARELQISHHTISDYMKSIYLKLGCHNRVAAIVAAQKLRIIKSAS